MTLQVRKLDPCGVQGAIYLFEKGDILPMHSHVDGTHISVVAKGVLEEYGPMGPKRVRRAGQVIDFPLGTEHEWKCIDGPAVLVNIVKQLGSSHNGTVCSDQSK